jgi:hypothetical protein
VAFKLLLLFRGIIKVPGLEVVKYRSLIEVSEVRHVLTSLKFGRVDLLNLVLAEYDLLPASSYHNLW